uniref:Uncharacterized protein n=1 Tax=Arundo donax TaxID=35708 RepID=A0A0A9A8Z8_ARUDO
MYSPSRFHSSESLFRVLAVDVSLSVVFFSV